MIKKLLCLVFVLLLAACGTPGESAGGGEVIQGAVGGESAEKKAAQPGAQALEIAEGVAVSAAGDEHVPASLRGGVSAQMMCGLYTQGNSLYYRQVVGTRFEVRERNLVSGEEKVLYTTDEEYVASFLVLDGGRLLLNLLSRKETTQYYTARYDTYLYDKAADTLTLVNEVYELDDYMVDSAAWDGENLFIRQQVQNGPEDYTEYYKYTIVPRGGQALAVDALTLDPGYAACNGRLVFLHENSLCSAVIENPAAIPLLEFTGADEGSVSIFGIRDGVLLGTLWPTAQVNLNDPVFFAIQMDGLQMVQKKAFPYSDFVEESAEGYLMAAAVDEEIGTAFVVTQYDMEGNMVRTFPPFGDYVGAYFKLEYCTAGDVLYYMNGNWQGEEPQTATRHELASVEAE